MKRALKTGNQMGHDQKSTSVTQAGRWKKNEKNTKDMGGNLPGKKAKERRDTPTSRPGWIAGKTTKNNKPDPKRGVRQGSGKESEGKR